jgi:hypothetical protein
MNYVIMTSIDPYENSWIANDQHSRKTPVAGSASFFLRIEQLIRKSDSM